MQENLLWRDPTNEEVEFIKKHWLTILDLSTNTQWICKKIGAIDSGNFQVARAIATKFQPDDDHGGWIQAKTLSGEQLKSKKMGFASEPMLVDFPRHFVNYFCSRYISEYPVLLIKLPEHCKSRYLAVPARETFQ